MVNCQETLLSSSPGKDSGFESAEDFELLPLSSEQLLKIREQVEFYLSDGVVTKDQFLLKHVTKSKEGWLSLKLMSSFRKVKSLCKGYDWHVVADALRNSELLEVNSEGSKVRRKIAIPVEDETRPARTIVAYAENRVPNFDSIHETFGECGAFVNVKLVKPGEQVDEAMKKVFGRYPKCRQLTCAVIEFDKSGSATKALGVATEYEVLLLRDCFKAVTKVEKIVNRERRTFSDSEVQKRRPAKSVPTTLLSWRDRSQPVELKTRTQSFSHDQREPKRRVAPELKISDELKSTEPRPRRFTISETNVVRNSVCAIRQPRGPGGTRGFAAGSMTPA
ncbi:la-related protein 6 [Galendromus occidentalis]|uniref:La-related protein 6 n=1 Tax=Galendromus occidentalis TaxID=34638 RepID=A0AAJ6QRT6_9ACAR|nr:la-related protein 6 [Galendromus occidentalis]